MVGWFLVSVLWAGEAAGAADEPVADPTDAPAPAASRPAEEDGPEAQAPVRLGVEGLGLGGLLGTGLTRPVGPGPTGGEGRVLVTTTWKRPVLVAEVLGQAVGQGFGYVGGQPGTTTLVTTFLTDRCETPCELKPRPGVLNLITHGGGALGARAQVIVQPGGAYRVDVKAQPAWTRWLALGLTGVGAGLLGVGAVGGPNSLYDPTDAQRAQAKAVQIGLLSAGGVALGGGLGVLFGVRSRAVVTSPSIAADPVTVPAR
jgi:hypothetical protein